MAEWLVRVDDRRTPRITLQWMELGTTRLLQLTDALSDDDFAAPSSLTGWTRAHVVAHAALNAQALGRLVHWAATGIETPMYRDMAQRESDIEAASLLPAQDLRDRLHDESARFAADLSALTPEGWSATVRTRQGRAIPAMEIPWMRVREVWLHAVDLDAGMGCDDIPPELAAALMAEVAVWLGSAEGCPAVVLQPTDGADPVLMGGADLPIAVSGSRAELLGWLTGRSDGANLVAAAESGRQISLPALPAWL